MIGADIEPNQRIPQRPQRQANHQAQQQRGEGLIMRTILNKTTRPKPERQRGQHHEAERVIPEAEHPDQEESQTALPAIPQIPMRQPSASRRQQHAELLGAAFEPRAKKVTSSE